MDAYCNDSEQRLLWIEHPNGERTGYLHLDRASVDAAVEDKGLSGQVVPQGMYLGTLYTESAITTGFAAAQEVASRVATEHQRATRQASQDIPVAV